MRSIDLLARFPGCEEKDVFDLEKETPLPEYDVILASMVINCIPTPRGDNFKMQLLGLRTQ